MEQGQVMRDGAGGCEGGQVGRHRWADEAVFCLQVRRARKRWPVRCAGLWCHALSCPPTSASTPARARKHTPTPSSAPSASRSTPLGTPSRSTRAFTTANNPGTLGGSSGYWSGTRRIRDRCGPAPLPLPPIPFPPSWCRCPAVVAAAASAAASAAAAAAAHVVLSGPRGRQVPCCNASLPKAYSYWCVLKAQLNILNH